MSLMSQINEALMGRASEDQIVKILERLITKDANLDLITDLRKHDIIPMTRAYIWYLAAKTEFGVDIDYIPKGLNEYRSNRISVERKGRLEIIDAIKAKLYAALRLSMGDRLLGRRRRPEEMY